jgi:two-component system, OmpR family, response regulator
MNIGDDRPRHMNDLPYQAPVRPSSGPPLRALVVDDEHHISDLLATALRYEGFEPTICDRGGRVVDVAADLRPDVILLDVMLPDIDGFEVARRLRQLGHRFPILFLTARDAPADAIHGLTVGGDDYIRKPFSLEEVVARVRSVLRRGAAIGDPVMLRFADLELDLDAHEVRRAGVLVELTPTEFGLLRLFLENPRRVLSRPQILDRVWRYDFEGNGNVVDLYVGYLRRKLDALGPPLLRTVRGVGYVLRSE